MRHLRTTLVGAVLLVATLTLAGLQPLAGAAPVRWSSCRDIADAECAGIEVPVDPARPDGPQFTLRLGRLPALNPAQRKGMLLIIPGGPGVGISNFFGQDLRGRRHLDEFRRQWDVVTFDPRGVGQSSPIRCAPDAVPPSSCRSTARPRPPSSRRSARPTRDFSRAASRPPES